MSNGFNISRKILKAKFTEDIYFTIQFIMYFPFLARNFIGTAQTFLWEYYFLWKIAKPSFLWLITGVMCVGAC